MSTSCLKCLVDVFLANRERTLTPMQYGFIRMRSTVVQISEVLQKLYRLNEEKPSQNSLYSPLTLKEFLTKINTMCYNST